MLGHRVRGAWCLSRVGEAECCWDAGSEQAEGEEQASAWRSLAWLHLRQPGASGGFLRKGVAGTHLCSGKTVLAGVEARSEQQDGDQQGREAVPEPGSEAGKSTGPRQTLLGEALALPLTV